MSSIRTYIGFHLFSTSPAAPLPGSRQFSHAVIHIIPNFIVITHSSEGHLVPSLNQSGLGFSLLNPSVVCQSAFQTDERHAALPPPPHPGQKPPSATCLLQDTASI